MELVRRQRSGIAPGRTRLRRECAREFASQFPGRPSLETQALVDSVGSRLAAAANDPRREFRFTVVAAPAANAFALPGGFVFITEPLVRLCGSGESEIAFFLGHEMAHILRGHAKDQLAANTFLNAVSGRLAGAGPMLHQVLAKGYSRDLELDADREGAALARAAGFDPQASIRALRRLAEASSNDAGALRFFSSHPPLADRIRRLEQALS